jgi:hypothetical protein
MVMVTVMVTVVAVAAAVVVSGRMMNIFFDKNKIAPQKPVSKHSLKRGKRIVRGDEGDIYAFH